MQQKTIKWAILGTSFISTVMASAIQSSETSELYAIGSRSDKTAHDFAKSYSIPHIYTNYHDLLNDPNVDAVYIGLPNHLHKEWIINAAKAGKHILCEKPLVISIDEAHEVIEVVKQCDVFCMEALMYRSHPFIEKIQALLAEKMIGDVKLYTANYTAHIVDVANPTAGGSIRNLGCYPISLIRLLAKAEPVEMHSMGRLSQVTSNDNQASVLLRFADESIAVVSTADDIKMFWQFDIHGTAGSIKVITNPWLPTLDENKLIVYRNGQAPLEVNVTADKPLYTYQIDVVNENIAKVDVNRSTGISLEDSLGNTIVLETWLQQVKNSAKMSINYAKNTI